MERISAEDIRNYDVLVMETFHSAPVQSKNDSEELTHEKEEKKENDSEKHGSSIKFFDDNHVGNNRLRVMLNIPSNGYRNPEELKDGNETHHIAEKMVNILCHECEPAGRFLKWQSGEDCFVDLGDGSEAVAAVRGLLQGPDTSFKYNSSVETDNLNQTSDDHPDQITSGVKAIDLADRRFSVSGVFKFASKMRSGRNLTDKVEANDSEERESAMETDEGEEKKRPRRPSLLRRSLDMTRSLFKHSEKADDGKKKYRLGMSRSNTKTPPKDNTSSSKSSDIRTSELNEYDVLTTFTPILSILPTDNVGNNRIRVMMDMQRGKFNDSCTTDEEKYRISKEIYSHAVQGAFSGRFVTKSEVKKDFYTELTENLAISVISWCLDASKPQYHKSNSIADCSAPAPAMDYTMTTKKQKAIQNESTPDLVVSTSDSSQTPGQRRNSITSSLKEMRSAALNSLKLRKQKKVVLSTLEDNKIEELQRYVKVSDTGERK